MVRQGKKKDIYDIQEIFYESVDWMKDNHIKQWHYEDLKSIFSTFDWKEFFLCVNSQDKAVGFMILSIKDINNCWTKLSLKNCIFLYKLTVRPNYTKLGYSSELLEFAVNYAAICKSRWLCLYCLKSKVKLMKLYENHGFRKVYEQIIPLETEISAFYTYEIETNYINGK